MQHKVDHDNAVITTGEASRYENINRDVVQGFGDEWKKFDHSKASELEQLDLWDWSRLKYVAKVFGIGVHLSIETSPPASAVFLISLDFELRWGIRDIKSAVRYRQNLLGVRRVVPALLKIFAEYGIHATWATVGFLFFRTRAELLASCPDCLPNYDNFQLSPYLDMESVGADEDEDPFHFGRSLIDQIMTQPEQEIATHTFSHYYCLEPEQNLAAFRADLEASQRAAANIGVTLNSIVFPGNQYDRGHLEVCKVMGLKAFRGNQKSWFHRPHGALRGTLLQRSARLLNSYWGVASRYSYSLTNVKREPLLNFPASRFLRPYAPYVPGLQVLQERRILAELSYAAKRGLVYHLWWHPHNFGAHLKENMSMLRRILNYFQIMRERHGMQSMNMAELASQLLNLTKLREKQHCSVVGQSC